MQFQDPDKPDRIYKAPPGMEETCGDLGVHVIHDHLVSYWKPSEEELKLLISGGFVELWIFGGQHPVVSIEVGSSLTKVKPQ